MRRVRAFFRMVGALVLWTAIISILWVLVLAVLDPPVTWTMWQRSFAGRHIERSWRDLDEVAHAMPLAVIAAEDQKFMDHRGFDLEAIRKAMRTNAKRKGKRIHGASTISQQTAKNVFLWQGRNFVRKGVEAWFTMLMETFWSKQRIVEVYLNVAETGPGLFGVDAASQHCFKRPAVRLDASQAALIAATLPAPGRYSCEHPSSYVRRRQGWILRQMHNLGDVLAPDLEPHDRELR
ncbi:MAG: monofunctional biosynthetic peptidoglycan transglycosylase [Flavobacteriales bacterium]|nr:monofunctional biosynthetic peptidoglycan transglycosylase [Flavobacteriales bacterium]